MFQCLFYRLGHWEAEVILIGLSPSVHCECLAVVHRWVHINKSDPKRYFCWEDTTPGATETIHERRAYLRWRHHSIWQRGKMQRSQIPVTSYGPDGHRASSTFWLSSYMMKKFLCFLNQDEQSFLFLIDKILNWLTYSDILIQVHLVSAEAETLPAWFPVSPIVSPIGQDKMLHFHSLCVFLKRAGIWKLFHMKEVEWRWSRKNLAVVHTESEIPGNPWGWDCSVKRYGSMQRE